MHRNGTPTFYVGLDLGKKQDFTALTILRQTVETTPAKIGPEEARAYELSGHGYDRAEARPTKRNLYDLLQADRFPLGTPYTAIAQRVREIQRKPPLSTARTFVVADVTGVGEPIYEMLKAAGVQSLRGVHIHGAAAVTRDGTVYKVPKRDLASTVAVLLDQERLRFAGDLDGRETLRHELLNFQATISATTGHDSYEAWREGDHDDLVLSLAMACWLAEYRPPWDASDLPIVRTRW